MSLGLRTESFPFSLYIQPLLYGTSYLTQYGRSYFTQYGRSYFTQYGRSYFTLTRGGIYLTYSKIVFNLPHTRIPGFDCADNLSLPNMANIVPGSMETSNSKVSSRNKAAVFPEW